MSDVVELAYPGRPQPWHRARKGDKTPRALRAMEHRANLALAIGIAAKGLSFDGPVGVEVDFDYQENETRIRITPKVDGKTTRADVDNLSKQVLEALELAGVVLDDAQVSELHALKIAKVKA